MMSFALSGTLSTTTTGDPVDLVVASAVRGVVDILPLGSGTLSLQFQVSADGSTGWTNIGSPIAVTNASVHAAPDFGVGRGSGWHWRAVATIAGGSPSFLVSAILLATQLGRYESGSPIEAHSPAVLIKQLAASTGDGSDGDRIDMRLATMICVGVQTSGAASASIEGSIDGQTWSPAPALSGGFMTTGSRQLSWCRYVRVTWTGNGSVVGSVIGRALMDTAGAN